MARPGVKGLNAIKPHQFSQGWTSNYDIKINFPLITLQYILSQNLAIRCELNIYFDTIYLQ